ncbi:hypothetical protein HHI36_018614, partial [Cryptolaemus montrouzieri]
SEALQLVDWNELWNPDDVNDMWNRFHAAVKFHVDQNTSSKFMRQSPTKPWIDDGIIRKDISEIDAILISKIIDNFPNVYQYVYPLLRRILRKRSLPVRIKRNFSSTFVALSTPKYLFLQFETTFEIYPLIIRHLPVFSLILSPKLSLENQQAPLPKISTRRNQNILGDVTISPELVEAAIKGLKSNSSPGLDGISV